MVEIHYYTLKTTGLLKKAIALPGALVLSTVNTDPFFQEAQGAAEVSPTARSF